MRKIRLIGFILAALIVFAMPSAAPAAQVSVGISVRIGPPPLPVVAVQPICPAPGYIWTPGYWAYGPDGYYWVPGTWVLAPVGMLWTPGYWGYGGGAYIWHAGYWGPHVGFYGGVHYGFGYDGVGFVGGRWNRGVFAYNTAVSHVDVRVIHNTYVDRTVVVNERNVTRVSYNGGNGIRAVPTREERIAMNERHERPMDAQMQHERAAGTERGNFASENHGRPAVMTTQRPGEFHGARESHPNNSFQPPQRNDRPMNTDNNRRPSNENNNRGQSRNDQPRGNSQYDRGNRNDNRGNNRGNDGGNGHGNNDRGDHGRH